MRIRMLLALLMTLGLALGASLTPARSDDAAKLEDLTKQVAELYEQGKYAEAMPLAEEAVTLAEGAYGHEDPTVGRSLTYLAMLYDKQGRSGEAEPLYKRALAIYESAVGPEHSDTEISLSNLADFYYAQGRYSEAEPLYRRVLGIKEKALGPEHLETATSLLTLAGLYRVQGRYGEAEPFCKRALAIREKTLGPEHRDTATSLARLAELQDLQGRYAEAEPLYKRALAIRENVLGQEHMTTATSLDSLAGLYRSQGRYAEAEPLYKRALAIREKAKGPEDPSTATSLDNLAGLYRMQGDYAAAAPLYRRALAIREKVLGPEHPYSATTLNNLAGLYVAQARYTEAEPLIRRALAIYEKSLGPEHPYTATSLLSLAQLYQAESRYAEAEPLFRRALTIKERSLGAEHPETASALNSLANFYQMQGRYADAVPLYKRALAIREKTLGKEHHATATSLDTLGGFYQSQGRYAEAEPLIKRALAIYEKILGPEHPSTASSLLLLAGLYELQGRYVEADPLYKRALAIYENAMGPEHPDTARSLNNLAGLYRLQGRYAEAEPLYRRALAIDEKILGPEHPATASVLSNLAKLYQSRRRYAEAEPLYKRALAIDEKAVGPDHPDTATDLSRLAELHRLQGRYAEAELLSKRALAIDEKTLGAEHPSTANDLSIIGSLYELQGRYSEAEPFYERVLAISEKALGPTHPDTAASSENLAYLHRSLERWSESAKRFRAACSTLKLHWGVKTRCHMALLDTLWRWSASHVNIVGEDTFTALRNEAVLVAQQAGGDRTSAAFARGTAQLTAKRLGANENAKRWEEIRNQIGSLDAAFNAAAGSGGTEAAQVLANLNTERGHLNAELIRTEAELKAKAPDFFDLIKPEPVSVEDLQATSGEKANILRADEALVLLVPGQDSEDKAFERESLILVVSKTKIGWAALPKTIDILGQPQPLARVIASLQGAARSGLRMKKGESNLIPFDLDIAHALFQALFASSDEIRAVLEDPAIKTWVMAPQGMFISLPYAALVMEPPSGDSRNAETLRKTKWLGTERTLTIVPSVSSLAIERLKLSPKSAGVFDREAIIAPLAIVLALILMVFLWRRSRSASFRNALRLPIAGSIVALVYVIYGMAPKEPEFLGFGDPDFARTNESRLNCLPSSEGERSETPAIDVLFQGVNTNPKSVRELKRLPGTCREVKSMAEAFKARGSNIVLGLEASESGVRHHPRVSEARIIAFATHGLITGSLDNTLAQPALAFTPPAEVKDQLPPTEDDGLLTTTDAATLDLQADWVLLSACDTAAKEGTDPDGLSGLARAFFYAGARSLLVSHWPVHDEAGMRLTTKAVELMTEDPSLTRPQAFRLSMKALLNDTSDPRFAHPAFWAPFFIVSPE